MTDGDEDVVRFLAEEVDAREEIGVGRTAGSGVLEERAGFVQLLPGVCGRNERQLEAPMRNEILATHVQQASTQAT